MAVDDDAAAAATAAAHRAGGTIPPPDVESTALYAKVYGYVEQYMSRFDVSHDFGHILRVLGLAKRILAAELQARPAAGLRRDAVVLAALLHDVGDAKYARAGEDAERTVGRLLAEHGCCPVLAAKVAVIVPNVSYRRETERPQLVRALVRSHPELAVVQDADRLDAIGAVGIGRAFAFGAAKAPERGLQGSMEHFDDKLLRLEALMKTETGKRLARERTDRLRQFQAWWREENEVLSA